MDERISLKIARATAPATARLGAFRGSVAKCQRKAEKRARNTRAMGCNTTRRAPAARSLRQRVLASGPRPDSGFENDEEKRRRDSADASRRTSSSRRGFRRGGLCRGARCAFSFSLAAFTLLQVAEVGARQRPPTLDVVRHTVLQNRRRVDGWSRRGCFRLLSARLLSAALGARPAFSFSLVAFALLRVAEVGARQRSPSVDVVRQTLLLQAPRRLLGQLVRDIQGRVLREGRSREQSQRRLIAYIRVGTIREAFIQAIHELVVDVREVAEHEEQREVHAVEVQPLLKARALHRYLIHLRIPRRLAGHIRDPLLTRHQFRQVVVEYAEPADTSRYLIIEEDVDRVRVAPHSALRADEAPNRPRHLDEKEEGLALERVAAEGCCRVDPERLGEQDEDRRRDREDRDQKDREPQWDARTTQLCSVLMWVNAVLPGLLLLPHR